MAYILITIISMTPKLKTFLERLFSTVILLTLVGGVLWWNSVWGYAILICLLCNLTTIEWYAMLKEKKDYAQRWLVLAAGLPYPWLLFLLGHFSAKETYCSCGEQYYLGLNAPSITTCSIFAFFSIALLAVISFVWEMRRPIEADRALRSVGTTLLAFIYPVWMFSFAIFFLIDNTNQIELSNSSVGLLLWIILVTKLTDICAYVSGVLIGGKIFGDRKMIPHISPKKTWEGFIGSLILTTAAGFGLANILMPSALLYPLELASGIIVIALLAVVGDLAGSLIKRSLAVKDSGSLLPGIGGIFDLIDSPAFTVSMIIGGVASVNAICSTIYQLL